MTTEVIESTTTSSDQEIKGRDGNTRFDAKVHRWHEKRPKLGTEPISIEPLISPEQFAAEREYVYKPDY